MTVNLVVGDGYITDWYIGEKNKRVASCKVLHLPMKLTYCAPWLWQDQCRLARIIVMAGVYMDAHLNGVGGMFIDVDLEIHKCIHGLM